jgi:hypothetical protein
LEPESEVNVNLNSMLASLLRCRLGPTLAHCRNLDGCDFLVHLGITILAPKPKAFQKLTARRLAALRRCEETTEPKVIGLFISGAKSFLRLWSEIRNALSTAYG